MATRKIVLSPKVAAPSAPLSQGVIVDNILYVSGQVGMNLQLEMQDGIENQTRQVIQNIGHVLEAAGTSFKNVVKVTVLLADIKNFDIMNRVYREFFVEPFPARIAYQAANLPVNALVEIEAIAVVGDIVEGSL